MNSTPHPRPGNADIPIGGFFFPRPIPISSFCPLCLPATPTSSPTLRPHKSFRCNTYKNTRGGSSNPIRDGRLHAIEEKQPPDHHERDGRARSQQQQAGSLPPPGDRPPETVNHPSHRVQPVQPPPARRNDSGGIDDGTGEQPELHQERSHIPHIPVQSIQRRKPQSHTQRRKERERQQRRQPQRRQRRPDPVSHCK